MIHILNQCNISEKEQCWINTFKYYRQNLTITQDHLDAIDHELENTTQRIYDANLALTDLRNRADDLTSDAQALKSNATALQEANVEGKLCLFKILQ